VTSHLTLSPLLLTVREAAQLLAISERTLWTLTHTGRLRAVRVGRAVRYARTDLEEFVRLGGYTDRMLPTPQGERRG
jgi:excisionase family DNA binding protein